MALGFKDAVQDAFEYAKDFADYLDPQNGMPNLRLEEARYADSEKAWYITLGFDTGNTTKTSAKGSKFFPETTREKERDYKRFIISDDDGSLKQIARG